MRGAPARVRLGGIGGFPSERRANVLWVGVIEGAAAVTALAAAVHAAMAPVVGAADEREYHPHLTLARLTRAADVRAAAAKASGTPIGPRWAPTASPLRERDRSSGHRYRDTPR